MYDSRRTDGHPVRIRSARQPLDIRVLDGAYRVVLRGYETASGDLPAGLYEVRTGWRSHENRQIVRVPPGGLELTVSMPWSCPTPLPGSEGFREDYVDAVRKGAKMAADSAAGLVTFVHGEGDFDAALEGLSVLDENLAGVPAHTMRGPGWAMRIYATAPGGHVLRRGGVDRSLWLSRGWTHLWFARVDGSALKPATSQAMLRPGTPWLGGGDAELRLAWHAEQALAALYDGEITPEEALAHELSEASAFDPTVGLLSGCLSLLALGRAEQGERHTESVAGLGVHDRLGLVTSRLVGEIDGHPDLFALLAAWAAIGTVKLGLPPGPTWPPMLSDSFDVLVSLDASGKWTMGDAGPLADVATARATVGPWLEWTSLDAWSTEEPETTDEAQQPPEDGLESVQMDTQRPRNGNGGQRMRFRFGPQDAEAFTRRANTSATRKVAQYVALAMRLEPTHTVAVEPREVANALGLPRAVARRALRELGGDPTPKD